MTPEEAADMAIRQFEKFVAKMTPPITPERAAEISVNFFKGSINHMSIDDKLAAFEEFVQNMDDLEEEIRTQ